MSEMRQPLLSPEFRRQQDFDEVVAELFGDQTTLEGFVNAFNQYFQGQYQLDFLRKLDAKACQRDHRISCSGAALMVESFVRQYLPNLYSVIFLSDFDIKNPIAHSVTVLIPSANYELPTDLIELRQWLSDQFKSGRGADIQAYHFNKGINLQPFPIDDVAERRKYGLATMSVPNFIARRYEGFRNRAAAEGADRVPPPK